MQLPEKYRPRDWSQVIGQDKTVQKIALLKQRGLAGRAFFISGQSGTGKTTIARLIAAEVADDFATEEIDAGACTMSALREMESSMCLAGFGSKGGRAYIINEAHGLRKDAIRQLLVLLERLPSHVVIIFTTTNDGAETMFEDCQDASPLTSRCTRLDLARRDLAKPFAERAQQIALSEGLGAAPFATLLKLVQEKRNNFRAVLQSIEAGELLA